MGADEAVDWKKLWLAAPALLKALVLLLGAALGVEPPKGRPKSVEEVGKADRPLLLGLL